MTRPLDERLDEDGEVVFSAGWDSGAPGAGAGYEQVFRLGTEYYLWLSSGEIQGPFDSLLAAINDYGLFECNTGMSFYSPVLSSEEVAASLQPHEASGTEVYINEEYWKRGDDGKFARHPDPYAGDP